LLRELLRMLDVMRRHPLLGPAGEDRPRRFCNVSSGSVEGAATRARISSGGRDCGCIGGGGAALGFDHLLAGSRAAAISWAGRKLFLGLRVNCSTSSEWRARSLPRPGQLGDVIAPAARGVVGEPGGLQHARSRAV